MAALSEPVRNTCTNLYQKMQLIYSKKLVEDGFTKESSDSLALMVTATFEGGIMLCLTLRGSDPLKVIKQDLPKVLEK